MKYEATYERPLAKGRKVWYRMRGYGHGPVENGTVIDAGFYVILVESPKGGRRCIFYDEIIRIEEGEGKDK